MKKILFTAFVAILLFAGCSKDDYETGLRSPDKDKDLAEKVEGRMVGAYVTWYGTSIPDPNYFTNLFYAFAELYIDDSGVYKGFKVQGDESRFQNIVNLKSKNPDLKISIAFSHTVENSDNKQNGGFSLLAKSDEYRKAFALDCKTFLENWGIDGVDMDWEFPGISWSGHAFDPAVDVANYVLLMGQLRETLGNRYLLTYAGYCKDKENVAGGSRYVDIAAMAPHVDFVNIMTYDMDEAPHHQSALNDPSAYYDCVRSVNAYLNAGMPANKLVLGIPFYGRHSFSTTPMSINYNAIIKFDSSYKIDNWDEAASVPYVTLNGQYYCGYDNEKSIGIKGNWLLEKGMKGMMYWDYDGDDSSKTLRKAVWQATMKK
jgi:chitinase